MVNNASASSALRAASSAWAVPPAPAGRSLRSRCRGRGSRRAASGSRRPSCRTARGRGHPGARAFVKEEQQRASPVRRRAARPASSSAASQGVAELGEANHGRARVVGDFLLPLRQFVSSLDEQGGEPLGGVLALESRLPIIPEADGDHGDQGGRRDAGKGGRRRSPPGPLQGTLPGGGAPGPDRFAGEVSAEIVREVLSGGEPSVSGPSPDTSGQIVSRSLG